MFLAIHHALRKLRDVPHDAGPLAVPSRRPSEALWEGDLLGKTQVNSLPGRHFVELGFQEIDSASLTFKNTIQLSLITLFQYRTKPSSRLIT